jgi:hypothetical protein
MSRSVTIAGYALLALAAAGYQVAGVLGRRTATLGQVLSIVKRSRLGRLLLLAAWMWLGWHLFVRGRWT